MWSVCYGSRFTTVELSVYYSGFPVLSGNTGIPDTSLLRTSCRFTTVDGKVSKFCGREVGKGPNLEERRVFA